MLDASTAAWLRDELKGSESASVRALRRRVSQALMVLLLRKDPAGWPADRHVSVRTLDGGRLRFRRDVSEIQYFPHGRNKSLSRDWHDATAIRDWWSLRDIGDALETLCDEHLKQTQGGEVHRRGAAPRVAEEGKGGGE